MIRVVAAAVVRDGRVLAARRARPSDLAGRWEFPGGKVEVGESDAEAVHRECLEELAVDVVVTAPVATATDARIELVLLGATVDAAAEPVTGADHDELRWLDADHLGDVDWLPVDAALLARVGALLSEPNRTGRV